ncbi:MAG: metal-dependent transcriptional regulator [Actinomycetota bacterium]|nr:metal-dependent transcriptional regulator [Actinomycetota bacterium]
MRLERLTPANEDYLEKVYELALISGGPVRSVDIAEELGVSKPSVNKGVSTLKKAGYATQERYGDVELTRAGWEYGARLHGQRQLLKRFLVEHLGVYPSTAEVEACGMSHELSDDTLRRWETYLEEGRVSS